MQYFKKYNLAFFHIPKTGGTSFRSFLKRHLGKWEWVGKETNHEPLFIKRDVMGAKMFDKTNVVTLIRDPLAVVVSYYDSIYSPVLSDKGKLKSHVAKKYPFLLDAYGLPFEKFVDWYVANEKSHSDYLLVSGKIPNNVHLVRLENLREDANRVLNDELKLNLSVGKIGKLNKANRSKPIMKYYTEESLNKVAEKYKWTFDNNFYEMGKINV
jgi:hypothetical protein